MKLLGFTLPFGRTTQKNIIREYQEPLVEVPFDGGDQAGTVPVLGTVLPTDPSSAIGLGMSERPLSKQDYDQLYHLAKEHHDVSFAVSNIVELSNTKLNISFDSSVSDSQSAAMIASIDQYEKTWYSGGRAMLVNSIFRQVAITGAVSGEAKPRTDLTGVGAVVLLSPKWVYFSYDDETASFKPFQQIITTAGLTPNIQLARGGYQPLSLKTYKYLAISRDEDKPYAIPPMLSALETICIEQNMLKNLSAIVKRLGMLGFLQVVVNAPSRRKTADGKPETDEQYISRVQNYLGSIEPEIEKGLSNGYVITAKQIDNSGTERKTDFEMTSSTADAGGASALMELIMQINASGLKQDPVFLGKNFSTTEALANVLLKKFAGQLEDYQKAAAEFLQHVYELHLRLQGFQFKTIKVVFNPPMLDDLKKLYEGLNVKFDYYQKLYTQGLISQQQFAQYMDLEVAAEASPRLPEGFDIAETKEETKTKTPKRNDGPTFV